MSSMLLLYPGLETVPVEFYAEHTAGKTKFML